MSRETKSNTSKTAHDTLAKKSRDEGVISGGHLVAKALKTEGVDTIFTLCGGHIIDIYDGCICLLYTSPSPRDAHESRMPSSA